MTAPECALILYMCSEYSHHCIEAAHVLETLQQKLQ